MVASRPHRRVLPFVSHFEYRLPGISGYTLVCPPKSFLLVGDSCPRLIHGSSGPTIPLPKLHLDRLIRFCRAHNCDRQTDRHTDHATPSVVISAILAEFLCVRSALIMAIINATLSTVVFSSAFVRGHRQSCTAAFL